MVNSLSDPYVKAFRWATDRLPEKGPGILAYVSNSSYISQLAGDGMRKHLARDFDAIYVLDLGGNVRRNPKLSGTTHNVFGIQVGVAIGFFVRRNRAGASPSAPEVYYARTGEDWRRDEKYRFLETKIDVGGVEWKRVEPDTKHTWLTDGLREDFDSLVPLVVPAGAGRTGGIFALASNGLKSQRDAIAWNFNQDGLIAGIKRFCTDYSMTQAMREASPDPFDPGSIASATWLKWSDTLRAHLDRKTKIAFDEARVRPGVYRPFVDQFVYVAPLVVDRPGHAAACFPKHSRWPAIVVSDKGARSAFSVLAVAGVPELHLCASTDGHQYFPAADPTTGVGDDNITDWSLGEFRRHYADDTITKWNIFHYVYALLHHPDYRTRYEANLRRELPRIPFAPDFHGFARAGERLMTLHVDYEKQAEFPLRRIEAPGEKLNLRVEKMKLTRDRSGIVYNDFLTLAGIPPEALEYRLGNRSALEWIIDQYQVSTDKRSGITNDPNRLDDEEAIVRLIGQVTQVSVETVKIVKSLPPLDGAATS